MSIDYRDFEGKKKDDPASEHGKAGFWWKETLPTYRGQSVRNTAQALERGQSVRHNLNLLHARMYGNFDMSGFGARQYARGSVIPNTKIAFNVTEAATDTLASKISKHSPVVRFQTNGADWSEQQKGKRLEQFVSGGFSYAKLKQKNDLIFVDACVMGTGGYKFFIDENDKVNVERVFIDEVLVDEADGRYGCPRQMIHGKLCHREKLLAEYGDSPERVEAIKGAKSPDGVEQEGQGDMVQVWEAWHLPSSKKAKDGVHCVVLDDGGVELECNEWKMQRFPIVLFRFKPRLLGFWGQGVAEILTGIQIELNRLVQSISEQLRRKGRGRIFMPLSAKVPDAHITNRVADIVYYNGNVAPTVDNSNAVAQEEFMQIDRLYAKAFQIVGVSEMSVSAKKPSGLDAGVAIREWEEIESERFAKQHQRWDEFHVELAETWLDFVREFGGDGYVTNYERQHYMETISAKDVMMDPGEYMTFATPSSSLPGTPAARRQAVKELMADGFVDQPTARQLLGYPDLEAEANLANAARNDVDHLIDRLLNGDADVEMPDKFTNLADFVERGTANLLFARNHGAPEKRLDKLAAAVGSAAKQLLATMAPPAPGGSSALPTDEGAPAPAGSPIGAPTAPNVNVTGQQVNVPAAPAVPPLIAG